MSTKKKQVSEMLPPDWAGMIPVKRYRFFTRYMKLCPNGEVWYECFMNSEIDHYERRKEISKRFGI